MLSRAGMSEAAPKPSLLATPVGRLRLVGLAEGLSFIALLGVAMPLKYMADMPLAVTWVGSIHGGLFMLYAVALLVAWIDRGWSIWRAGALLIASVVPFGPFIADRSLVRELEAEPADPPAPSDQASGADQ